MTEDADELRLVCDDITRRQRYRAGPKRISYVVNELIARRGYLRLGASAELEQAWQEAVGDKLAGETRPGNIRRGVLEVYVRNSGVMQELTFQKMRVLKRLVEQMPQQKIRSLRFRVGAID
jgi:predicted nucleic acid-binding Zn ribbon protein